MGGTVRPWASSTRTSGRFATSPTSSGSSPNTPNSRRPAPNGWDCARSTARSLPPSRSMPRRASTTASGVRCRATSSTSSAKSRDWTSPARWSSWRPRPASRCGTPTRTRDAAATVARSTPRSSRRQWIPTIDVFWRTRRPARPATICEPGVRRRGGQYDFFRARIVFPIFDVQGNPVGFGGRKLPDGEGPKYKNTSDAAEYYSKSDVLYGLHWA